MQFTQSLKIAIISLMTFFSSAPFAFAQLSIEKTLVAKSQLQDPIWQMHEPASEEIIEHGVWNGFLGKYVATDARGINLVKYGAVSAADRESLKTYLSALQSIDITRYNRREQYAFWLNLYNASIVNVVLENYPSKSILNIKSHLLDLKGPFDDAIVSVNGKTLTPDDIESGIVRPIWNDPRLHYGFNCAAISCPNLGTEAFNGSSINGQLDQAATSFINDPRGVKIKNGKVTVSKIFFWYSEDFGGSDKAILDHIRAFASPELAEKLAGKSRISKYEYDWALNER
ncbi:MAG: DUF547 domain-containing protein [Pseudomonadota bacterium]